MTGTRRQDTKQIVLTLDEYEAFRLTDQLVYTHARSAEEMGIFRTSFSRLIEKARKKVADFIIEGGVLVIEGGTVHFRINILQRGECGHKIRDLLDHDLSQCPECHSQKIINMAGASVSGEVVGLVSEADMEIILKEVQMYPGKP